MIPRSYRLQDSLEESELARLVDDLTERIQAGETLDIEAVAELYPAYADKLGRLLPVIQILAEPNKDSPTDEQPPAD